MKIVVLLLSSYMLLFSNIDSLIGDFEAGYTNAEKKMSKSKSFNKNMMAQKKARMKKMSEMNKMSPLEKTIKHQQSMNKQENILKVINKEIEKYFNALVPTILIISLFIFLILLVYVIISAMNSSSLRHRINVLENMLSDQPNNREENSNEEFHSLLNNVKKINLRLDSAEAVIHKLLFNDGDAQENPRRRINDNKAQPKKEPIKKKTIKKEPTKELKMDELMVEDDFAMNENEDEELSLDLDSNANDKKKSSAPLTNLSSLDMDIGTTNTMKKNKNIKEMEEFSLNDFDE